MTADEWIIYIPPPQVGIATRDNNVLAQPVKQTRMKLSRTKQANLDRIS